MHRVINAAQMLGENRLASPQGVLHATGWMEAVLRRLPVSVSVGCAKALCTLKYLQAVRDLGLKGGSSFLYLSELRVFRSDLHTPSQPGPDPQLRAAGFSQVVFLACKQCSGILGI